MPWPRTAVLLLALALPAPLLGQQTTAAVLGRVVDESEQGLPGASVTLSGPALMTPRATLTGSDGHYRFADLPPGTYQITFSLSGLASVSREALRVPLGATVEQDALLVAAGEGLREEVTVRAEAAGIDTQTTKVSANYDREWTRNAPVSRFTFFDFINTAPGVSQTAAGSEKSTSLGSSTTENSYLLDGNDFTAPIHGASWPWPSTDVVDEVEVLSLGAPAEYGNVQGAVFNLVTRQGGDAFHGELDAYLQHDAFTGRNTGEEQDGGLPYHRERYRDVSLQLGGPLRASRLWFFASYQRQRDSQSLAGTDPLYPSHSEADRVFLKLNYEPSPRHRFLFAYHDDYYRLPYPASAAEAPSTAFEEHGHNPSPNLVYTALLSERTLLTARLSGFYGHALGDPLDAGEPLRRTRFVDLDTGEVSGGIAAWYDGRVDKTTLALKLQRLGVSFLGGRHDLAVGLQGWRGGHDYLTGHNDEVTTAGGAPLFGLTQAPFHQGGRVRALGAFLDDSWHAGERATLSLGVRLDHARASFEETGLFTWDTVSPRLGFNLKLFADGRTVLKGHYGRYRRGIVTGEFEAVAPTVAPVYLFSGRYDAAGQPTGAQLLSDNTSFAVDPGLRSPCTDQVLASLERSLGAHWSASLTYIHKRGARYTGWRDVGGVYQTVSVLDAETGTHLPVQRLVSDPADSRFLLTNPDGLFSRYHGLIAEVKLRLPPRWLVLASLVLSRASGRIGSSLGGPTDEQSSTAGIPDGAPFGQNPNDFLHSDGRLIGDRPFALKASLVWQPGRGLLASLNLSHQSGRAWARQLFVEDSVAGLPTTVLAERLTGARRVADQTLVDARLQKELGLGAQVRMALFVDGLNLLNDGAHEGVADRLSGSAAFGRPTDFIPPRRLMVGTKVSF